MKSYTVSVLKATDQALSRAAQYENGYLPERHREVLDWSTLSAYEYMAANSLLHVSTKSIVFDCVTTKRSGNPRAIRSDELLIVAPPSPEALLIPWALHKCGRRTIAYGPSAVQLTREFGRAVERVVIAGQLSRDDVELAPDPEEWSPILLKALLEGARTVIIEKRHRNTDDRLARISPPSNSVRILAPWQSTDKWIWVVRAFAPRAAIELRSWPDGRTLREFLP